MHVPDTIKRAILHGGYYYKHAIESANIIRDWMKANNIDSDFVKDSLIDHIENGTDQWENFIEFLEDHDEQELHNETDD
ncbi:hypothetical protein GXP75_21070 [Bacillus sp. HU-1818]|uniref:hypothetical protein n=1 Tax=Bacillus sp. HU-1818 TaxID=2704469 RepID=UPI001F5C6E0B|nr:hypothetical protein [Bacillus sp. HU-1818]MCI3198101.1 hypothetical protein [Bacillus sp. HU-1818]